MKDNRGRARGVVETWDTANTETIGAKPRAPKKKQTTRRENRGPEGMDGRSKKARQMAYGSVPRVGIVSQGPEGIEKFRNRSPQRHLVESNAREKMRQNAERFSF